MAVQGYVVKAETFYDMKLRKEGEIVAAGIDLAAVYPSFFRKPQTDEEELAAAGIVADYEAVLKKEKQKKADTAGFTFKVKAETFFKTLRKTGDLVKSAERLDLMYPAYFALIGVDAAADDGISGQAAAADDGISGQAAAADDGISGQTTAADDGISGQTTAADDGDEAGIADAGAEAEVIGEILTAAADAGIAIDTLSDEAEAGKNPGADEPGTLETAEIIADMPEEAGAKIAGSAENQAAVQENEVVPQQEDQANGKTAGSQKANGKTAGSQKTNGKTAKSA